MQNYYWKGGVIAAGSVGIGLNPLQEAHELCPETSFHVM